MKRTLLILLACASFLFLAKSGQAQNPAPVGPIQLEVPGTSFGPVSDVYQLYYLKVSDTKPAQYIWLFHKVTAPLGDASESDETVFGSLNSPALLGFVAHLPAHVRICHSPIMPPSRGKAQAMGSNEPGLLDFISLCRRSKIDFVFGTAF